MKALRICSCGFEHKDIPPVAKFGGDGLLMGYYFNCQCCSTIFIPESVERQRVEDMLKEVRKSPAVAHADVSFSHDFQENIKRLGGQ